MYSRYKVQGKGIVVIIFVEFSFMVEYLENFSVRTFFFMYAKIIIQNLE